VVAVDLHAVDDHHTAVTFTVQFQPKYGLLGWLLGRVVMEQRFERRLDAALEGIAEEFWTDVAAGSDAVTA
jgi:hypothetical protein